jgi:hypothetical protein
MGSLGAKEKIGRALDRTGPFPGQLYEPSNEVISADGQVDGGPAFNCRSVTPKTKLAHLFKEDTDVSIHECHGFALGGDWN